MTLLRTLRLLCVAIGALFLAIATVNVVKVSALRPAPSFDIEKLRPTGEATTAMSSTPPPSYVIPLGELKTIARGVGEGTLPTQRRTFLLSTPACSMPVMLEINAREMVIYAQRTTIQ